VPEHRAGFVALLGPPNAGKSTLLNCVLAEKLAIVTAKPQTTRSRILGIHNRPHSQLLFLDTPGLHDSERPLGIALKDCVNEAAEGCDLALLLIDLTRAWEPTHDRIQDMLLAAGTSYLVVGTKDDLPAASRAPWPPQASKAEALRVSARTREGVEALLQQVEAALPLSPPLYPDDELTDRPLRWLAGELVREALFEELGQELPYQMAVEVVKFDESRSDLTAIRANLLVQRDSQKRIVIGSGGAQIRRIGIRARKQIEALVGNRVHLDLWVKIDPRWLKNPQRIEELGYR
jgi:GTP-binding protein Era